MKKISKENLKGALVSALLMALLSMAGYIIQSGDVFSVNLHELANIGIISSLTAIVSLLKNILTTPEGMFVGAIQVK